MSSVIYIVDKSDGHILPRAYLPVVKVKAKSKNCDVMITTLLDAGSEINIISKRMAKKLGLRGDTIIVNAIGVGGVSTQQITKRVKFVLEDKMGQETNIEAIVLEKTCGSVLSVPDDVVREISEEININPDKLYTRGGEIGLLLGMGEPPLHKLSKMSKNINGVYYVETPFGPSIVGTANKDKGDKGEYSKFNVQCISVAQEVDLWQYLEADTAGTKKECPCQSKTDEEVKYETVMKDAWSRNERGRFEVRLPWKINPGHRSQVIHTSRYES